MARLVDYSGLGDHDLALRATEAAAACGWWEHDLLAEIASGDYVVGALECARLAGEHRVREAIKESLLGWALGDAR